MTNRKIKEKVINVLLFIIALLISIFFALPFIYMILMSLMKSSNDIFTYPPKLYSGVLKFSNYSEAFKEINMGRLLVNTLIMVVSSMGIGIAEIVKSAFFSLW